MSDKDPLMNENISHKTVDDGFYFQQNICKISKIHREIFIKKVELNFLRSFSTKST
ncbi:hypothetical protein P689_119118 [Candidatus Riesia pediculischaeffi PTSU]|uniref:Uncharacterized protein n=1 Tax=Candidatus Riesia pediculischaeffi PTSU TaxID=1401651 RepID=A0A0C1S0Q4_9ENTR|nr:hypothetical protein P689_119118 [Candidatus Riesia pediculischaeffi PTSU]